MRKFFVYLFFVFAVLRVNAQELYPHVEPASNIPKGVLGVRVASEGFNELTQFRSQQSFRFMFGLSAKWMFTQSFNFSNHHGARFPSDFINNDSAIGYHTHGVKKGNKYPYRFENLNLNIKYRFLSRDGEKSHFRMASYLELAGGNEAHDEAEASLMGDVGGIGAGITATKLQNRLAVSGNAGVVFPQRYFYQRNDSTLEVRYGRSFNYSLSFGFLCFPLKYKDYKQTNVNVYAEFIGKVYDKAVIRSNDRPILVSNVPALEQGNYLEFRPSLQFIFHSNLRVDLSIAKTIYSRSYLHNYPVYYVTIQRYFYFKGK